MIMGGLFDNDPTMRLRDTKGRFCTAERHYADKARSENTRLRYERDKYKRAWLAVCERACRLERELAGLKRLAETVQKLNY